MKSLNVKKIAAIAAGAALIGTAFAAAAVTVDEGLGNYVPSLYSNGTPQVQIVLGSAADVSDAIAAGNIAAAIANKAYTTSATATPAATTGTTANQTVSVSVTNAANAVPAGTYGFTSLFGDDRVDSSADTVYNITGTRPSYNSNLANMNVKEISSTTTALVKDGTVDTKGKYSGSLTSREYVNLFGQADYSSSADKYVLRNPAAWYSLTFSPGLPSCLDTTYGLGACPTNSRLDRAGVKVRFLGTDYLVTHITESTATTPNTISTLTLSKASVDQIIPVGTVITTPEGHKVKLDSMSAPQGSSSVSSIGLVLTNAAGTAETVTVTSGAAPVKVLGSFYVQVPDSFYTQSGNSTARIIFATGSLKLSQNASIDESIYGKWQTYFTTSNVSASPSITRIQIGNDLETTSLNPGDSLDIIKGAPGYKLTYKGSTLKDTDYTELKLTFGNLDSMQIGYNTTVTCDYTGVEFIASRADAFKFGNDQASKVRLLVKNRTADVGGACSKYVGYFVYQNASSVWTNSSSATDAPQTYRTTTDSGMGVKSYAAAVKFYYPGTGSDTYVYINATMDGNFTRGTFNIPGNTSSMNITIPEILNDSGSVAVDGNFTVYAAFGTTAGGTTASTDLHLYDGPSVTTTGKVNYTTIARSAADQTANFFGDVPYYSPRGSYVATAPAGTEFIVKYANTVGRAQYVLSTEGTNMTAGTTTITCTTGTACDVGGTKITIPSGAAIASGSAVVTQLNTATKPLVVLDSEADAAQPQIVIGGPWVNTVAASMTECAKLGDEGAEGAVVTVEGNKLCVAGRTAADTQAAADELIGFLAAWDPV
ncbi:MAG: S-layer protein [Candidatus Micrarchaeota archaeon]